MFKINFIKHQYTKNKSVTYICQCLTKCKGYFVYMVLKYKIDINRRFLNVTNSEYFDVTTTHFVYNHVN